MVCPYDAIAREEYDNRIVSKSDLCQDRDIPACVSHCPNEALDFIEETID